MCIGAEPVRMEPEVFRSASVCAAQQRSDLHYMNMMVSCIFSICIHLLDIYIYIYIHTHTHTQRTEAAAQAARLRAARRAVAQERGRHAAQTRSHESMVSDIRGASHVPHSTLRHGLVS